MCDKKFELKKIDQKIQNKISGRSMMQNRGNIFFLQKSKYLWKIEFFYEKNFFLQIFVKNGFFLIEIIVTNLNFCQKYNIKKIAVNMSEW